MPNDRLALYTTIHPGSAPFLAAWWQSVQAQTDSNFDLWVGLDLLAPTDVIAAIGVNPQATWVPARPGMTPTQIRQQAIERMVAEYAGIVFVDSDDLLEPERVARARCALATWDVCGCAMRLVDAAAQDIGVVFTAPAQAEAGWDCLVRANCFGLGNTAYRTATLQRCLPIPAECVMEDWFLITRAWTQGGRLGFDAVCGMAYRQHGSNMTAVLPPFTEQLVMRETHSVLQHYHFVLNHIPELRLHHRHAIQQAFRTAEAFHHTLVERPETRRCYVEALNRLPARFIWFDCVAHPALESVWRNGS